MFCSLYARANFQREETLNMNILKANNCVSFQGSDYITIADAGLLICSDIVLLYGIQPTLLLNTHAFEVCKLSVCVLFIDICYLIIIKG